MVFIVAKPMEKINLSKQEKEIIRSIRNSLVHTGSAPSIRNLMAALGYRSTRSVVIIIDRLIKKGFLKKDENGKIKLIKDLEDSPIRANTIDIPLIGEIACGTPILAEENFEMMIPVSTHLAKPPHKYFLLRAKGDSMDKSGIDDGDIVLVRQQQTADINEKIVALIDDEATIKRLGAMDDAIVLKPDSTNKEHKPIILNRDFLIQGVVIATIPKFNL